MKLEINNKGGQMVKAPKVCPGNKPVKAKGGDLRAGAQAKGKQ